MLWICPKDVKTSRYLLTYILAILSIDTLINQLILINETKQFRLKVTLTVRDSIQSVETRSGGFGMILQKYYFHATSFPGLLLSRRLTRKEIKGHGDEVDFDLKSTNDSERFVNKRSENKFELSLITPVLHLLVIISQELFVKTQGDASIHVE